MNGDVKCKKWGGLGRLGVTHGHRHGHHRSTERIYDLLFKIDRNCGYILPKSSTASHFCHKSPIFTHPTCIWRRPFEFREDAWNQKSRIPWLWSGIVSVIRFAALAENFDGLPDLARWGSNWLNRCHAVYTTGPILRKFSGCTISKVHVWCKALTLSKVTTS